ncbi:MAG: diguanylate cyclase [Bacillota bacterium]
MKEKTVEEKQMDKLTGLMNYEAFVQDFEGHSAPAADKCEDLSVVMIDIDQFKRINDDYGHETGDAVLISIADHLKHNLPENAYIYRYSGDQFAVLLTGTEKEKAFLLMEKIRESYCSPELRNELNTIVSSLRTTLSIGISCCPEDGIRMTELVRKAEGALFRAKSSGRNKVCLSREEKMITKTSHYTYEQLQRLAALAKKEGVGEAVLLREALDDLLKKYDN